MLEYIYSHFLGVGASIVLVIALIIAYFILLRYYFCEESSLNDVFNLALQGMSLHSGFVLIYKVCFNFNEDKNVFGVFQPMDAVYIALGGFAVIYVSLDAMRKKYEDLVLGKKDKLPSNAT